MAAGTSAASVAWAGFVGLKSKSSNICHGIGSTEWNKKIVSNGSKTHCMKTWNPINNKFETLSYLPPLSDDSIEKQIDNMLKKGWTPCIEFDEEGSIRRKNNQMPGYYDGRYWTLWKLPMFGCADSSQVLKEIHECKQTYPNAYIHCLAVGKWNLNMISEPKLNFFPVIMGQKIPFNYGSKVTLRLVRQASMEGACWKISLTSPTSLTLAFDNKHRMRSMAFVIHKPAPT